MAKYAVNYAIKAAQTSGMIAIASAARNNLERGHRAFNFNGKTYDLARKSIYVVEANSSTQARSILTKKIKGMGLEPETLRHFGDFNINAAKRLDAYIKNGLEFNK